MSENVEVVRRLIDAANAGDMEAVRKQSIPTPSFVPPRVGRSGGLS
jgi:hypothetical protein